MKKIRRKIASIFLVLGTFFCPFGFDILFAAIMKWTGSYWNTVMIFYCLSGLCFGAYWVLSRDKKVEQNKLF